MVAIGTVVSCELSESERGIKRDRRTQWRARIQRIDNDCARRRRIGFVKADNVIIRPLLDANRVISDSRYNRRIRIIPFHWILNA